MDTKSDSLENAAEQTSPRNPRACGFRFSKLDAVVLSVGGIASVAAWYRLGEFGLLPGFVLAHFFLFCNVFRIRRGPELIWAALFLLNWTVISQVLKSDAWITYVVQLPVTVALVVYEMRRPTYHGVFSRVLNEEHIDTYLRGER